VIAGAPAQVPGQCLADLITGRIGRAIEQRFCRHQKSGGAVATLGRTEISEGLLKRMEAAVCHEAFDGQHLAAVTLDTQHQTRQHRLAIEQHRARAALAQLAAVFGAAQVQVFTQHLEQRLVVIECDVARLSVDDERELSSGHGSAPGRRRHSRRPVPRCGGRESAREDETTARSS
jgi:hypothetical protein